MIQKALTYLLVTMIAMQSFVAIADVHQPHQSGEQHLEFNHDHPDSDQNIGESDGFEVVKNVSLESFSSSSLDEYDCHHCCHCHGVSYLKAVSNGNDVFPYKQQPILSTPTGYLSYTHSPDIRPPIV